MRETRPVRELIERFFELRDRELKQAGVTYSIRSDRKGPEIRIYIGVLSLVFDNLYRNSIYWLKHFARVSEISSKEIHVYITEDGFDFYDSGKGVRNSIEDRVFDLFMTDKPEGEGQGLGLFLTRKLLEAEGCSIDLLPDRNDYGRRYKFHVDLRGIVDAGASG